MVSCWVVVENSRTSLFSDCLLMKTVTSTKESWCTALPIRKTQNQVHCQIEMNRLPTTAATGSKNHPAFHSSKSSKRRSTEHHRSLNRKKKCLQIHLNGVNQLNRCSEPAEPLDSPHESPISKRKNCSRRRPSTRTFVWIFANMRHFFRTSSPGLYENCNFRFAKRP